MKLEQAIGFTKKILHFEPDHNLPLPLELIGIELEYEGVRRRTSEAPEHWTAVSDGSLRNNGIEYVLTMPLYGKGISEALDNMQEHVGNINPVVSERCSVHVHINVSDMDVDQVLTFIILYLIFEKAIVAYHGGMREDNIFCVPYYKAPDVLSKLVYIFTNPEDASASDVRHILSDFSKYYGLNIGAIVNHGSLEFRHMAGTTDMSKVYEWISIIQHLKKTALNTSSNYMEMLDNMSGNSTTITRDIFGDDAAVLQRYVKVDDLIAGARLSQRIIKGSHLSSSNDKENRRNINKKTRSKINAMQERVWCVAREDGAGYEETYTDNNPVPPAPDGMYPYNAVTIAPPSFRDEIIEDTSLTETQERFVQYLISMTEEEGEV